MSIKNKKKKIFGKIAAAKTLTEKMPKLKLKTSFPSINVKGESIAFLSDLIKALIGFQALVVALVDILTHSLVLVEREIKDALKVELKNVVSCGVDPQLPSWMQSTGSGIVVEVSKVDFNDLFKTDPNSIGGKLLYNDITPTLTDSTDFNTFLYGVIQNDGTTYTWKNIFDITFNSLGNGVIPNNTLTIKANPSYNNKTLTDLNNNFINGLTLFKTENIVTQIMDIIYGSVSSIIGKTLKQLENDININGVIDKMVNNVNKGAIPNEAFSFGKADTYKNQAKALAKKRGSRKLNLSSKIPSSVPASSLTSFNQALGSATSAAQKGAAISDNLKKMANLSALNVKNPVDLGSVKLDFIQEIIDNLTKAIVGTTLSPKVVTVFMVNYKIIYGPNASFGDGVDFIKKNKNLFNNIIKKISAIIIKILLKIALKEIARLVSKAQLKKQKEKIKNKTAQLTSLAGAKTESVKKILEEK